MKPSENAKRLADEIKSYEEACAAIPRQPGGYAELGPLSDEDEAILDRVWDKLREAKAESRPADENGAADAS